MNDKEPRCYGRYAELERLHTEIERLQAELTQMQLDANAVCQALNIKWAQDGNYPEFAIRAIERLHGKWARKEWERDEIQAKLAKMHTEFTDACAARDALARECNQLEEDREYNASLVMGKDRELARMRGAAQEQGVELAQARDKLAETEADFVAAAQTIGELRKELKGLQGANRALGQQVADVTENRDYWYDKVLEAGGERDKMRKRAQTQSDKVQRDGLSPCQKAGLERLVEILRKRLDHTEDIAGYWIKEYDELEMTFATDGGTVAKATEALGRAAATQAAIVEAAEAVVAREVRLHEAAQSRLSQQKRHLLVMNDTYRNLQMALEHKSKAAAKLLGRLATLDAAEAALDDCGGRGIYTKFDGPADAIMQMATRIEEFEEEFKSRPAEAGITDAEMAEALQHERALRQVAETGERTARKMLAYERQLRRKTERRAGNNDDKAQVLARLCKKANQRATSAEALAQVTNEKTARLLERLASHARADADKSTPSALVNLEHEDAWAAKRLAAQIRKALDDNQA